MKWEPEWEALFAWLEYETLVRTIGKSQAENSSKFGPLIVLLSDLPDRDFWFMRSVVFENIEGMALVSGP